jgi:hypothetical protein
MAKTEKSPRKTAAVRIDAGVAMKAKIAAEHQGLDLSDYLTALLKSQVDRDWAKARKAIMEA